MLADLKFTLPISQISQIPFHTPISPHIPPNFPPITQLHHLARFLQWVRDLLSPALPHLQPQPSPFISPSPCPHPYLSSTPPYPIPLFLLLDPSPSLPSLLISRINLDPKCPSVPSSSLLLMKPAVQICVRIVTSTSAPSIALRLELSIRPMSANITLHHPPRTSPYSKQVTTSSKPTIISNREQTTMETVIIPSPHTIMPTNRSLNRVTQHLPLPNPRLSLLRLLTRRENSSMNGLLPIPPIFHILKFPPTFPTFQSMTPFSMVFSPLTARLATVSLSAPLCLTYLFKTVSSVYHLQFPPPIATTSWTSISPNRLRLHPRRSSTASTNFVYFTGEPMTNSQYVFLRRSERQQQLGPTVPQPQPGQLRKATFFKKSWACPPTLANLLPGSPTKLRSPRSPSSPTNNTVSISSNNRLSIGTQAFATMAKRSLARLQTHHKVNPHLHHASSAAPGIGADSAHILPPYQIPVPQPPNRTRSRKRFVSRWVGLLCQKFLSASPPFLASNIKFLLSELDLPQVSRMLSPLLSLSADFGSSSIFSSVPFHQNTPVTAWRDIGRIGSVPILQTDFEEVTDTSRRRPDHASVCPFEPCVCSPYPHPEFSNPSPQSTTPTLMNMMAELHSKDCLNESTHPPTRCIFFKTKPFGKVQPIIDLTSLNRTQPFLPRHFKMPSFRSLQSLLLQKLDILLSLTDIENFYWSFRLPDSPLRSTFTFFVGPRNFTLSRPPFGWDFIPYISSKVLARTLSDFDGSFFAYLDDILSWQDTDAIRDALVKAGFFLSPTKCTPTPSASVTWLSKSISTGPNPSIPNGPDLSSRSLLLALVGSACRLSGRRLHSILGSLVWATSHTALALPSLYAC